MTDSERRQHIDDLNEVVKHLEFRIHMGRAVITRLRTEFLLVNAICLLLGTLIGGFICHMVDCPHGWWGPH